MSIPKNYAQQIILGNKRNYWLTNLRYTKIDIKEFHNVYAIKESEHARKTCCAIRKNAYFCR